jgi:predicted enzyme related to lactoylglutathione lyase
VSLDARFVHTNLVAKDWRTLASFYERVFGCTPVPPERDFSGPLLEAGTGVPNARLAGLHLRLPGYEGAGPTLEIFQYEPGLERAPREVNRPGFAHIAFAVPDVAAARRAVLDAGGRAVGEVVSLPVPGAGACTFTYVTDPEGNVIELQSWGE